MADKALIKNGKIVVIDRAGVKTIPTVTGGVKSIEVTLTENSALIDIDLTPLNLVEGSTFDISISAIFLDSVGQPGVSRSRIRLNNITTADYQIGASVSNLWQIASGNSYNEVTYITAKLIRGEIIANYSQCRNTNAIPPVYTSVSSAITLRNNNITKINSIKLTKVLDDFAVNTKIIITKLD